MLDPSGTMGFFPQPVQYPGHGGIWVGRVAAMELSMYDLSSRCLWSCKDDTGRLAASGVIETKMWAGKAIDLKKVILVKLRE